MEKPVVGYEGLYTVTDDGNVFTIKQKNKKKLSQFLDKDGYPRVFLQKDGKRKQVPTHRIVAIAFLPNPNRYTDVNHIDKNRKNPSVSNLEWCSREYNMLYTRKKVQCIETGAVYASVREATAVVGGRTIAEIRECCRGRIETAYKLHWKYTE